MQSFATAEGHAKIPALIEKVCVTQGALKIDLIRTGLADAIGVDPAIVSHRPSCISPRRSKCVDEASKRACCSATIPPMVDPALLKFVARAAVWWQSILDGKTIADVAKSAGVSERLVGIHLPAAFLAPDILELIVDGRQPSSLTVGFSSKPENPVVVGRSAQALWPCQNYAQIRAGISLQPESNSLLVHDKFPAPRSREFPSMALISRAYSRAILRAEGSSEDISL